jgi:hypothetical protein
MPITHINKFVNKKIIRRIAISKSNYIVNIERILISLKDLGGWHTKSTKNNQCCKRVLEVHHENKATTNIPIQNET